MIDFSNIKQFSRERPDTWTCLGAPEAYDNFSQEHKDQIYFLNPEASKMLYNYLNASKLVTGPVWKPFAKGNFKNQEGHSLGEDTQVIKKWLFNRRIPFHKFVFLLPNYGQVPLYLTWKMVVKYSQTIFFADDIVIFDQTNNWCLFYFHEDCFYFGWDNGYDPEVGYKEVEELNQLKKQFPKMRHPYINE